MQEKPAPGPAIKGVIFDFGGVFTQSEVVNARLRDFDALIGLPPDTLHTILYAGEAWEGVSTGKITVDDYWAHTGALYEDRLPADFRALRRGLFHAEPINEATVAVASRLRPHYRLALCSNALGDLQEILDSRPDIAGLFEVAVISVNAGLRKPDPAILRMTADRLGLPVGACLLVDDKPRNTNVATAIGMQAIVFESPAQLERDLAACGLLPRVEQG